ncbi:MAG: hypothetical protein V1729_04900 [Candidatus Woesearchaeota archaeon]
MVNKVMRNVSKKTTGHAVDTVADYVDIMSQMVVEYFNQRYKIQKKVEDVKRATLNALYGLKKEFLHTLVEGFFLLTGVAAIVVGGILLLNKILPLEYIFLGYGLLVTIGVLLKTKVNV